MSFLTRLFGPSFPTLTPEEVQAKHNQSKRPILLDVRQPAEFKTGHVPGAKLIPLNELPKRMKELPKDREIVCICQTGSRSSAAAKKLAQAGYTVFNMRGGMNQWVQAGLPVRKY